MKAALGFALTLSCLGLATSVTPVQKAVQMLEGMLVKSKAAKHEENVQYAGFSTFCTNTQGSKAQNIKDATAGMELLDADIEKANSEVERLGKEIGGHESDITGWSVDKEDATKVRDEERATYLVTHTDYMESIEALGQAMTMLKKQDFDRAAKSFLQKVSAFGKTPDDNRKQIQAFLQMTEDPDPDKNLGYQGTAYKFQSGGIVAMLEKLKGQFTDELNALEKTEVARRQTFTMLLQDLSDQTKDGQNAIEEKTMTKAKNNQASIDKSADLKELTGVRDSDQKYLDDLTSLCDSKKTEFESRTKLRDQEIEALDKAVEILSGDDVSGNAEKHLPSLLQGSSFAQLRASTVNPGQRRLIDFLRSESVRLDSHVLSTLAVEAAADPFKKIKQLIGELIERLMTEATNEATHKGWCDKELGTNKHTRETKSAEVDTLTSSIDGLTSDIASLKKDIAKTNKEVSKIEASVAEFTMKRNNETADNAAAVKDAQDGQKAIGQAVKVLQEFYAKAAKATVLAQQGGPGNQPEVPEIFDGAFQGQQAAKGGVVGMLEVIQSDFARLEADTKSAEQAAQNEYDEFMSDSAQAKASLSMDLKHAKSSQLAKEGELTVAKEDLVTAQETLNSALKSFEQLKEPCLSRAEGGGQGQTYADRKARRKDEIESLKQALELLSADNLPTM